jgi:hypothetical protein
MAFGRLGGAAFPKAIFGNSIRAVAWFEFVVCTM